MELTAATVLVSLAGVFLICFMKGAFGGGFSIVGIPLLSIAMDRDGRRPSCAIVRGDGPVCAPLLEALNLV